jgi:aspartyl/asparaginyl beta-hydroxylase (cupin superfamily)
VRLISQGSHIDYLNNFLAAYSSGDPVVWDTRAGEWTRKFRDNWRDIRDEFRNFSERHEVPLYQDIGLRRYHLGIVVPNWQCEITLDGKAYRWREGEDILFDDNYEHSVINYTPRARVVLFIDVPRHYQNPLVNMLNRIVLALAFVDPEVSTMFTLAESAR